MPPSTTHPPSPVITLGTLDVNAPIKVRFLNLLTWVSIHRPLACELRMEPLHYGMYHVNRFKNLTFIGAFTSRVPEQYYWRKGVEGVGGGGGHVAITWDLLP